MDEPVTDDVPRRLERVVHDEDPRVCRRWRRVHHATRTELGERSLAKRLQPAAGAQVDDLDAASTTCDVQPPELLVDLREPSRQRMAAGRAEEVVVGEI